MKFVDRVHSNRGSYLTEHEYAERTDNELRYFDERVTVHDLPPIYHYWSNTYLRPKLQHFGYEHPLHFFQTEVERACLRLHPGVCRIVSLGSGNCDLEVGLVVNLLEAGSSNFVFECVDINPTMLERGQQMAASQGVGDNMRFVEGDLNHWRPEETVDCVIANQVLHHVVELELCERAETEQPCLFVTQCQDFGDEPPIVGFAAHGASVDPGLIGFFSEISAAGELQEWLDT